MPLIVFSGKRMNKGATDPVSDIDLNMMNVFFSLFKLDIEIRYPFLDPYALNPFLLCLIRICILSLYLPSQLVLALANTIAFTRPHPCSAGL